MHSGHFVLKEWSDFAHCPAEVNQIVTIDTGDHLIESTVELFNDCYLALVSDAVVKIYFHEGVIYARLSSSIFVSTR